MAMQAPVLPDYWFQELVHKHNGTDPTFIMEKELTETDTNKNENRLLIPMKSVKQNLLPFLSEQEKAVANLLNYPKQRKSEEIHANYEGLKVKVYNRAGWKCHLLLTCWESTGATIIKGGDYKELRVFGELREKDRVKMWAFRQGAENKLCFVIAKVIRG